MHIFFKTSGSASVHLTTRSDFQNCEIHFTHYIGTIKVHLKLLLYLEQLSHHVFAILLSKTQRRGKKKSHVVDDTIRIKEEQCVQRFHYFQICE